MAAIRIRKISSRRRGGRRGVPDLFDIVEGAYFRPEQVHDHVARVEQHPIAVRQAFHSRRTAGCLDLLEDVLSQRADMALRAAAGHDQRIGYGAFAPNVDGDDVLGFIFIQRVENELRSLGGVQTVAGGARGVRSRAKARPRRALRLRRQRKTLVLLQMPLT